MEENKVPAIPPRDYKGSIGNWQTALIERNLWDGKGWYGDVMIDVDTWWEILEECEGDEYTEHEEDK